VTQATILSLATLSPLSSMLARFLVTPQHWLVSGCSDSCEHWRVWVGIVTGNPRVFWGYLYPYLPKTHTHTQGTGFHGYGLQVLRVRQPM
jgi:hypothetical protein